MSSPFKSTTYEVVSGGASDPVIISGVIDPSVAGVSAPEGSMYMRFVGGAGQVFRKTGAGDTDWSEVGSGGGGGGPHASTHLAAGSDSLTLTDAEIAAANKDGVAGTVSMRTLGAGAQQATAGDDSRLSDARTPTTHATSHQNGGGDEVSVAGLTGLLATAQTPATHSHVEADVTDLTHLDANAVHDNVSGEIAAVIEKLTPVAADVLIIEDSAATNTKKKVQIGNLPGGAGAATALATTGADVGVSAASPPSTGQVLKATAATTATWQNESGGGGFGSSTEKIIGTIRAGDTASHDSATPLVVSQFQLDPSEYVLSGTTISLVFRAVASNGGGVVTTNARIYNVTDGEYVGSGVSFTSASPSMSEEILTIGAGAGEVDNVLKIYECRIWVTAPDAIDDTIELGSAELRLINTIN